MSNCLPLELWNIIQLSSAGTYWALVRVCKARGSLKRAEVRKLFVRCRTSSFGISKQLCFVMPNGDICDKDEVPQTVTCAGILWRRYRVGETIVDNNNPMIWGTHATMWFGVQQSRLVCRA